MEIKLMEDGGGESTGPKIAKLARIPPKRGQVKVRIFKLLWKTVKGMASKLKPKDNPKSSVKPLPNS
ncbi:hypothetical protein CDL15_Pgr022677 [Punica granatum]|uniref:Uncharacterized protein n=1 Tax=Punica granatum TaxID=22663 RepID=A0A218XQV6_PUNGR|nr:hypothetical protein CDL15_Pgr022677 [Punica granatum]